MKKIPLIVSTLLLSTGLNMATLISKASAEIPEPECITAYGLSGDSFDSELSLQH